MVLGRINAASIFTQGTQTAPHEGWAGTHLIFLFVFCFNTLQIVVALTSRYLLLLVLLFTPEGETLPYCSLRTHILLMGLLLLLLLPRILIFRLHSCFDLITSKGRSNYNGEGLQSEAWSFITHNYEMEM